MVAALDFLFETNMIQAHPEPFWGKPDTSVFVYGTGTVGQETIRFLLEKGIPVAGFMDHRIREERHLLGIPIFQPDDVLISREQRTRSVVVIAIHNRDARITDIIERMKALGYQRVIALIEFYTLFGADLQVRYWLTSPTLYHTLRGPIESAYNLLSDDTSRSMYVALLKFRLSGNYSSLPSPDMQYQYFPKDLPAWQSPVRLVDCGAYNGDTISSFIDNGTMLQAIAAFEPDQENFKKLARFAHENQKHGPEIFLWPCGVSHSTTQLRFETGHGEGSAISTTGDSIIQCVSLDEALPTFAPTLLKMDIEGAEYDALLGAQRLITTHWPGLAISIYHRPEHLWQIPLLIAQIAQNAGIAYHYGLRLHAQNGFDTIFYAIPQ